MVRLKNRYLLVQILYPSEARKSVGSEAATRVKHLDPERGANRQALERNHLAILFRSPTPDTVDGKYLTNLIRSQIVLLFGDQGVGTLGSSLAVKYFSNATSTFIVRCNRACVRQVWAALTLIGEIKVPPAPSSSAGRLVIPKDSENPQKHRFAVVMQVVKVSGTIKKAEEEAIERARALCGRVKGFDDALKSGISSFVSYHAAIENDEDVGSHHRGIPSKIGFDQGDVDVAMDYDEEVENSDMSSGEGPV